MGNSAGKESETLRDAVHTLLELQLAGGACGGSEGREEDGEEEVWQGIFANDLDEDGFYEMVSASDMTAMRMLQPGNLKLLAREALSNILRFMEARQASPPMLPELLNYEEQPHGGFPKIEEEEDAGGGEGGHGGGETGEQARGGSGGGGRGGGRGGGVSSRPFGGDGKGDEDGDDEDDGDFPLCFASVALHAAINLLSFPGFCVDEEAADWITGDTGGTEAVRAHRRRGRGYRVPQLQVTQLFR
eukprot:jgi/Undpi1/8018/HiC_scaffold_24.g10490.m1